MASKDHPIGTSARACAQTLSPGCPVRWGQLEASAFAGYGKRRRLLGYVLLPLGVLAAISPLLGFTALTLYSGHSRFDSLYPGQPHPTLTLVVAGACFALSMTVPVLLTPTWWCQGRRRSSGMRSYFAVAAAAAIVAVVFLSRSDVRQSDGWAWWIAAIAAAAVLDVAALVVQLAASTPAAPGRSTEVPVTRAKDLARLSAQQQAALRADLDAAITDLADRSVITEPEARLARAAPLGALTWRMAHRPKQRRAG